MIGGVKACEACTRAKRKCGKQLPSCERCVKLRLDCAYQAKPSHIIYGLNVMDSTELSPQPRQLEQSVVSSDSEILDMLLVPAFEDEEEPPWFLAPDTWCIQPGFDPQHRHCVPVVLNRYRSQIKEWLRQWVKTGECAFIHSKLYSFRFPHHIQDAYSCLSLYLGMTNENEDMVWRIIQDKATSLSKDEPSEDLDLFEHVARVQALTVYEYIGLFGGDIRQSYLAELRLPILRLWTQKMFESAVRTCCSGLSPLQTRTASMGISLCTTSTMPEERLWYSWILAESVRRTRSVATGVESLYQITKYGTSECQGFLMFTSKRGAWAAKSATAWNRICSAVDAGFEPQEGTVSLFAQTRPDEVDEFTTTTLEVIFGPEMMERWRVAAGQDQKSGPG